MGQQYRAYPIRATVDAATPLGELAGQGLGSRPGGIGVGTQCEVISWVSRSLTAWRRVATARRGLSPLAPPARSVVVAQLEDRRVLVAG